MDVFFLRFDFVLSPFLASISLIFSSGHFRLFQTVMKDSIFVYFVLAFRIADTTFFSLLVCTFYFFFVGVVCTFLPSPAPSLYFAEALSFSVLSFLGLTCEGEIFTSIASFPPATRRFFFLIFKQESSNLSRQPCISHVDDGRKNIPFSGVCTRLGIPRRSRQSKKEAAGLKRLILFPLTASEFQ